MKRVYLIVIVLIGITLRVIYLVTPDLDSDQAIMGLMARHILEGEFPIFYWGEHYEGPIESYFAAIIFYLFGSSRLTLSLSPFIFYLIFIFLVYRLAKEMFNEKVALIAMLLAAASPPFLIWYSVIAYGNYMQNLTLGTLLLLMTYRFVNEVRDEKAILRYYIVIGFTGGLAWWMNFQIIHFLLTTFIFMFLKDKWSFIKRGIIYLLPSFMIGSSLFWYYNLTHHWASIMDIQRYSEELGLSDSLSLFLDIKLPWVFGPFAEKEIWHLNKYFLIIYGVSLLFFILRYRRGILDLFRLSLKRMTGAEILFVFVAIFSLIIITRYNSGGTIRYYLPLYSAVPIILASFIINTGKVFKPLPVMLIVLLVSSNLYGDIKGAIVFDSKKLEDYNKSREREKNLFGFLEGKGLRYVTERDYWKSYRFTFDASERVIFAPPTLDWHANKYPRYTEGLYASGNPAFMWRRDSSNFELMLKAQGITYIREVFDNYFYIIHSLKMPVRKEVAIPASDMTAISNYDEVAPKKAIERDVTSLWYPKIPKDERVYFEIQLKRPHLINRVSILNGGSFNNNPSGYELEVSMDRENWKRIMSLPAIFGGFIEKDGIPVLEGGYFNSVFEPVKARYVRIKQGEGPPSMNWHIAEVFIYSPLESIVEENSNPSYLMGLKYFKEKKWWVAASEFFRVIEKNPDSEDSHYHLWLIAKELGIKTMGDFSISYNSVFFSQMVSHYEESGETEKADLFRKKLIERFSPAEKRSINFGGMIEFLGYDIGYNNGKLPDIVYYWKAVKDVKKEWHAFIHFIGPDGRVAFQNDHILSSMDKPGSKWVKGEYYKTKKRFLIDNPEDLRPGTYSIRLGVWDPKTEKRLKVKEGLLKKRDDIIIGELRVTD